MKPTWLLVANGARARLFEAAFGGRTIIEIDCYTNPEARAGMRGTTRDRAPTVNESVGMARHSIEPHTTQREKSTARFAASLRDVLDHGRRDGRYGQLVLIAPPRFLGALHTGLSPEVRAAVTTEVRHDLTALHPEEIRERLPERAIT